MALRTTRLPRDYITFVDAVPVLTGEATIADILATSGDLALAATALADARRLDVVTSTGHLRHLHEENARQRLFASSDDLLEVLELHRHLYEAA
ncbi:hypothetical protein [Brevibacterium yomogidense]|uniref:hypothetical protein n=1 Tax=Brevibacterium yomogidense TaxID=946573 RepID=UPI0018E023C0|nr:hypothetical protein [Brevibacterium yomogidense]